MFKKIDSLIVEIPEEVKQIECPGFFDAAHMHRSGLGETILERDLHRGYAFSPVVHIVRLTRWVDMDPLKECMYAEGYYPARLVQILPMALLPELRLPYRFEAIFALGSMAENGSVPSIFLPKNLESIEKAEAMALKNTDPGLEVRLNTLRQGRGISADFLSQHNSKGSLFAVCTS